MNSPSPRQSLMMRLAVGSCLLLCILNGTGQVTSMGRKNLFWSNLSGGEFMLDTPSIVVNSPSVVVNNPEPERRLDTSQQQQQQPEVNGHRQREGMHVLYTLSGNKTGFIGEWVCSLKSSLITAPLDMDLTMHVLTDGPAYRAITPLFEETQMNQWRTRNQISIQVYNVESKNDDWKAKIKNATGRAHKRVHTIGAFYRLFAFEIVPKDVPHVVYMDTDAIMMANLQEIWHLRDSSVMFQWGETECSGFVVMNMKMWREKFWDLNKIAHHLPNETAGNWVVGDQAMLRKVSKYNRDLVKYLPSEWDNHMANGLWRVAKSKKFTTKKPKIGYVHFNGGEGSTENVFDADDGWAGMRNFIVAKYYARHPWNWVRYQLETQVRKDDGLNGYKMQVNFTVI